jgi:putative zinc finger protein
MTHLEVENLASDYLEGLLEPAAKAGVEAHLRDCAACRDLLGDLRRVVELCHSAEELEPAPWLISKILQATIGQRKPTLREQLATFFRPAVQPRVAYAVAMAVFSFSIIINAARIDLRNLTLQDLNPRTWVYRADRAGHLLYARAEKFYYDLRVVYEIESRFRRFRSTPQPQEEEKEPPKSESQPGGSTDRLQPGSLQLATVWSVRAAGRGRSPSP